MNDVPEYLLRFAVLTASSAATAAIVWLIASKLGALSSGPFDPNKPRTWSFGFAVFDAAVLGMTMGVLIPFLPTGATGIGIAGGIGAIVAQSLVPRVYRAGK